MLKKKRHQVAIKGILKSSEWVEEPDLVKDEFLNHFHNRFKLGVDISPSLDAVSLNPLSSCERDKLEHHISCDEIKRVVSDSDGDRVSGLDGFTFKFFTTFWDLLKDDIVCFVQEFFCTNTFPKGNRLSGVIRCCLSSLLLAFIKGRNILDGSLILNKVLSWYRQRKKELMVFKVDFEKAFDSLHWDFLDLVMEKLSFGVKWSSWIQEELGLLKGASIGQDNMNISHLMLQINVHKSKIISIGVFYEEVSRMASVIGCRLAKLPLKYLGVPVGCNMSICSNWNAIIEKFSSKFPYRKLVTLGWRLPLAN
nr:hypothetical protein [Tanacetum cinerariifolium]